MRADTFFEHVCCDRATATLHPLLCRTTVFVCTYFCTGFAPICALVLQPNSHILLHLILRLIFHLSLHIMLHRCLLMCLHLVVAQSLDGIHGTLLNSSCLPFISCSMLTFARQPLFILFAPLLPKCLYDGLSISLLVFHSGMGVAMRQSNSRNHKKMDYLIPRCAPKTLAI